MQRISTLLILILLVTSSSIAQKKLTLDEAISIALQNNTSLITSINNLERNKISVKSSKMELLPNLSASAGWGWSKIMDDGGQQTDYLGTVVTTPATEEDNRSYSVRLGGNWVLFNGLSNYANIKASENEFQSAKQKLEKLKQDIVLQTQALFYNIIKSKFLLNVRKENLEYNKKFTEFISEKVNLGASANADLYAQQVQEGNAELSVISAENEYQTAMSEFLDYLSLNVLDEYELINPLNESMTTDSIEEEYANVSELVKIAFNKRADVKSYELSLAVLENNLSSAKGGMYPSLSGNYGFSTSGTEVGNLFNRNVYSLSLSLNIPIFSNFKTAKNITFARIAEMNGIEEFNSFKNAVKKEVKLAYLDLTAAKKGFEVSKKTVKAAFETRRVNREKYNLGASSIVEVLKADSDYQSALRTQIDAAYFYIVKKESLLNSIGKLDYKVYELSSRSK